MRLGMRTRRSEPGRPRLDAIGYARTRRSEPGGKAASSIPTLGTRRDDASRCVWSSSTPGLDGGGAEKTFDEPPYDVD